MRIEVRLRPALRRLAVTTAVSRGRLELAGIRTRPSGPEEGRR